MSPEAEQPPAAAQELHTHGESAPPGGGGEIPMTHIQATQLAAIAANIAFLLLAARLGPHWKLADQEKDLMGEAWGPILLYVLPKIPPWIYLSGIALMTTVQVVTPRLEKDRELAAARERKETTDDEAQTP